MTDVKIGLLSYPGVQQSALLGFQDFFQIASDFGKSDHLAYLDNMVIGIDDAVDPSCETQFDVIILPPTLSLNPFRPTAEFIEWLQKQHQAGATLCSVCSGTFCLALTGLLKNRHVTTHWQLGQDLQQEFPEIHVRTSRMLIDEGDIMTAGGVMAWTDLALALIERFHGRNQMVRIAKQFLVDPGQREQRYYASFAPNFKHKDDEIRQLQHHLHARQHIGSIDEIIQSLIEQSNLSERDFNKRFQAATGLSAKNYVHHLRIEKARAQLETDGAALSEIAEQHGYEDVSLFGKIFARLIGLTPREYRQRFGIQTLPKLSKPATAETVDQDIATDKTEKVQKTEISWD